MFQKGKSGNPRGRQAEPKLWRDALRVAASSVDMQTKKTRLLEIAERCVAQALAGDTAAMRELGNRLDGMPTQQIEAEVSFLDSLTLDEKRRLAAALAALPPNEDGDSAGDTVRH